MFRSRDSITPMEYEYNDGRGPIDANSPFANLPPAKKRPHAVLESPSRHGFATPDRPQLREPASQHYLFSQANRPLPATPSHIHKSSAWDLRTPKSEVDFSSGGETPNTPAQESEAATPDTQMANGMKALMSGGSERKSPKKERRQTFLKSLFSSSPSPSKEDRKSYSKKAENRIMKRRSKARQLAIREDLESDDDDEQQMLGPHGSHAQQHPNQRPLQKGEEKVGYATNAGHFLSWLEVHPRLPGVLTHWLHLSINAILAFAFLYIFWKVWSSIQADVDIESQKYMSEAMVEIAFCAKQYQDNRCHASTRVPAMEQLCGNWEACMQRDPRAIAKAKVGAITWAKIINAFVEEISWKSMVFSALMLFGGFNLSNWAFGVLRGKQEQHQHIHSQPQYPPQPDFYPPTTPQRVPSGGFIDQQSFYTPSHGYTPYRPVTFDRTQSMPALTMGEVDTSTGAEKELRHKSPRKKSIFS